MTPARIIQDWYSEHADDIRECGIDGFHATELMAALTPLFAANPWRTDVENAPIGEQLLCWQWTPDGIDWHAIGMKKISDGVWECGISDCTHDDPIAFATLNPPEIDG